MNVQEMLLQLDDVSIKLALVRKDLLPGPLHPNVVNSQATKAYELLRKASADVAAAQAELSAT
jgi:hypothetical protein